MSAGTVEGLNKKRKTDYRRRVRFPYLDDRVRRFSAPVHGPLARELTRIVGPVIQRGPIMNRICASLPPSGGRALVPSVIVSTTDACDKTMAQTMPVLATTATVDDVWTRWNVAVLRYNLDICVPRTR